MRIAVLGAKGLLGSSFAPLAEEAGHLVLPLDREDADVTDLPSLRAAILPFHPDAILDLAAYTKVDQAESEEEACYKVNVLGGRNAALMARECGAMGIYVSSDYVFDGKKEGVYTVDDPVSPLSVYGKSKAAGEKEFKDLTVIRTSWLYGSRGPDFVRTMIRLAKEGRDLRVVGDQVGSPTYAPHLSLGIIELLEKKAKGIYHLTGEGYLSWYEFARLIFETSLIRPRSLVPVSTAEYGARAPRPLNSRLDKSKLDSIAVKRLPKVEEGLDEYLGILRKESLI